MPISVYLKAPCRHVENRSKKDIRKKPQFIKNMIKYDKINHGIRYYQNLNIAQF